MNKLLIPIIIFLIVVTGCSNINPENKILVTISDHEDSTLFEAESGITIDQLLRDQSIILNPLDKIDPPLSTELMGGELILITRVTEELSIVESILNFEQQSIKNESLAEGQSVLIEPGVNGRKQSTFRVLFENGKEVSRTLVKEEIIQPAKPEILMIGVQTPFTAVKINGLILYISAGNGWVMNFDTGNRRVVVATSDLDGRVFSLSPDKKWLLYSRSSRDPSGENINSLWLQDVTKEGTIAIDTGIRDVVQYADWVPGKNDSFAYSTVEPRATPPGWQANNDLRIYTIGLDGKKVNDVQLVESNSGGIYGWWGTVFQWSPDGNRLAYSRPDSIGLVDTNTGELKPLLNFEPFQPTTDWAWVPSIQWSPDGAILYTVQKNLTNTNKVDFNLTALIIDSNQAISLIDGCGLFCYPIPSPADQSGSYNVSYLSSITSTQSEKSRYSLFTIDRDGSNRKKLYPGEGQQALDPQFISWSPSIDGTASTSIVFLSEGNMMIAELASGAIKQITGDGLISKVIWR